MGLALFAVLLAPIGLLAAVVVVVGKVPELGIRDVLIVS